MAPVHSPERTRRANSPIRSSTACTSADHVLAVDHQREPSGHPQRHVEHGPVLGGVDVLAGEHRVAMLLHARPGGPRAIRASQRLGGDPVLRVVEGQVGGGRGQAPGRPGSSANSWRRCRRSLPTSKCDCRACQVAESVRSMGPESTAPPPPSCHPPRSAPWRGRRWGPA